MSWAGLGQGILDAFQGGPLAAEGARQRMDIQKQDALDRQRESDFNMHELLMQAGATPVVNGLTKRTVGTGPSSYEADAPIPGVPGAGGIAEQMGSYVDKADPSRTISWKDHSGQPVAYELPTPETQIHQQMAQMLTKRPMVRMANDETARAAGNEAQAREYGRKMGDVRSDVDALDIPGASITLNDEQAKQWGLQPGYQMLRRDLSTLPAKIAPVQARVAGQENIADKNNAARATRTQASIDARASGVKSTHVTVGKDGQQSLLTVYNNGETEEAPLDATAAPPKTGPTPGQSGVMDRFNQRRQDEASKQHEALQTKEQAQWDLHGQYGDVLSTPDGETFVDPASKTGREIEMNAAQRLVFKNRYNQAEKTAKALQDEAKQIRQKYGWGEFAPDAQTQADAGQQNTGQPSAAPTSSAPPAGRNPRRQGNGERLPTGVTMGPNGPESSFEAGRPQSAPKFASREQVQRYAQQKGVTEVQALKEFTGAGYKVK